MTWFLFMLSSSSAISLFVPGSSAENRLDFTYLVYLSVLVKFPMKGMQNSNTRLPDHHQDLNISGMSINPVK